MSKPETDSSAVSSPRVESFKDYFLKANQGTTNKEKNEGKVGLATFMEDEKNRKEVLAAFGLLEEEMDDVAGALDKVHSKVRASAEKILAKQAPTKKKAA